MEGKDVKSGVAVMVLAAMLFLPVVFQQVGNPISETLSLIDSTVQTAAALNAASSTNTSATSTVPVVSTATVTASVVSVSDDRAGKWNTFAPGKNSSGVANDYTWSVGINASSTDPLIIKSIDIRHNMRREAWSTSQNSLYPLVVTTLSGNQINTAYTQNLVQIPNGITMYKIYGQTEAIPFIGGTIQVTFTNGLVASAAIPASTLRPSVTITALSMSPVSSPTFTKTTNATPTGSSTSVVSAVFNVHIVAKNGNVRIGTTRFASVPFATLNSFVVMKNGVQTALSSSISPSLIITPGDSPGFAPDGSGDHYILSKDADSTMRLDYRFSMQGYPTGDSYAVKFIGPAGWADSALGIASSTTPVGSGWITPTITIP